MSRGYGQITRNVRSVDRTDSITFYKAMDTRHGLLPRVGTMSYNLIRINLDIYSANIVLNSKFQ